MTSQQGTRYVCSPRNLCTLQAWRLRSLLSYIIALISFWTRSQSRSPECQSCTEYEEVDTKVLTPYYMLTRSSKYSLVLPCMAIYGVCTLQYVLVRIWSKWSTVTLGPVLTNIDQHRDMTIHESCRKGKETKIRISLIWSRFAFLTTHICRSSLSQQTKEYPDGPKVFACNINSVSRGDWSMNMWKV